VLSPASPRFGNAYLVQVQNENGEVSQDSSSAEQAIQLAQREEQKKAPLQQAVWRFLQDHEPFEDFPIFGSFKPHRNDVLQFKSKNPHNEDLFVYLDDEETIDASYYAEQREKTQLELLETGLFGSYIRASDPKAGLLTVHIGWKNEESEPAFKAATNLFLRKLQVRLFKKALYQRNFLNIKEDPDGTIEVECEGGSKPIRFKTQLLSALRDSSPRSRTLVMEQTQKIRDTIASWKSIFEDYKAKMAIETAFES
jgi:hypothetical protein